jgi:DNA modification methylase
MTVRILKGDCRDVLLTLPADSVHCVVTSPPYWGLRDYGTGKWDGGDPACEHKQDAATLERRFGAKSTLHGTSHQKSAAIARYQCKCGARRIDSQIGLESTYQEYVDQMVAVFREVRRVLRPDGTLWLNLGDSYAATTKGAGGNGKQDSNAGSIMVDRSWKISDGLKPKDLCGIPWRVAFALQADGWWLRQDIIWSKTAPKPENIRDRCCKSHEYIFLLTKSPRYYFDSVAIAEPTEDGGSRTKRSVWHVSPEPFSDWVRTSRRVRVPWDEPCDGKKRITSPDCPLHGDQSDWAPMVVGDEHEVDRDARIGHTETHRAQELSNGSDPSVRRPEPATAQRNLDLLDQICSVSAIDRNNQTHRTDLDPGTNRACNVSAQTIGHTPGKSKSLSPSGLVEHNRASNIGPGGLAEHPSAQTDNHNEGKSFSCTCEWYIEKTEKTSHFATFPPALIEPCILAGCPQGGTVLDPFGGAGTTGLVADRLGRNAVLIELNPDYAAMAQRRIQADAGMFAAIVAE